MSGVNSEVVQCPNCKEKVPKTLYCLNCGYPLYKIGEKAEETKPAAEAPTPPIEVESINETPAEAESAPEAKESSTREEPEPESAPPVEPVKIPEPELSVEAPLAATENEPAVALTQTTLEEKPEEPPIVTAAPQEEVKESEVSPVSEPEPVKEEAITSEEVPPEPDPEATPIQAVIEMPVEVQTQAPPASPEETPPARENLEISSAVEDTSMVETKAIEYVPDAYMNDVVEHVARSIALKIRLVKLFREGEMKEETFSRLFGQYVDDGKVWINRRDELCKEASEKIEEVESAYAAAEDVLEELEVRKTIGDASPEEYNLKLPAVKWDLDYYDLIISERRKKLEYLERLGNIMSESELKDLREQASVQYNTVDALEFDDDEKLPKIKETLYESIKLLG
jgi:hypothetical protein